MRLTEAYMALGIVDEAQTAAAVLGHNFPDSDWYKHAYTLVKTGGVEPTREQGLLDQQGVPSKIGLGLDAPGRVSCPQRHGRACPVRPAVFNDANLEAFAARDDRFGR